MDEKTLMAISVQLTHLQLQINALFQLFLLHHPQDEAITQTRHLLHLEEEKGLDWAEAVRERLRQGIVVQDLLEAGLGHLWGDPESRYGEDNQG